VRSEHLIDGAERFTTELTRYRIGAGCIGIDDSDEADASCLLQRLIDAGVVAAERAGTDDRNVDRVVLIQMRAPVG